VFNVGAKWAVPSLPPALQRCHQRCHLPRPAVRQIITTDVSALYDGGDSADRHLRIAPNRPIDVGVAKPRAKKRVGKKVPPHSG
jgi:hypothetical protein